ncbi:DNA mismatch repair protein MutS [Erythrobacter sp. QSSC1-22B]|uniref:Smr/MutS family protein n=1 Tax=Erythrobacter sp. QSSC1-22B TaxID=1860125 RepID=UPI0008053CCB|nr:Smr/MutS family protein [Erythrobacter sp. QSSC1-22B]OBX18786.1 DNA mismatch repair protein MutS [Erythrobacter sp. QSSC1-22B]
MSPPRGLTDEEAEAWHRVAETVTPLVPRKLKPASTPPPPVVEKRAGPPPPSPKSAAPKLPSQRKPVRLPPKPPAKKSSDLDSHWDRKLKAGTVAPDFTLDLHGLGLDAAYMRLMSGVAQARAMNARTVLLVTGKSRPVDPADRGQMRGAIRAKVLDWLAASEHGSAIAAIRKAHRHHGGDGALTIVLKRER